MADHEHNRKAFEDAVFNRRFRASIQRNPDPPKGCGALDFISVGCPTQAELCRRDAEGHYVDEAVSAMWWGWCAALASGVPPAAPMPEELANRIAVALECGVLWTKDAEAHPRMEAALADFNAWRTAGVAPAAPTLASQLSDHIEQRLLTWRQQRMNRSGDRLALDDFMDKHSLSDLIDFVCDEGAISEVTAGVALPRADQSKGGA
jgi:hypothetical protein